MLDMVSQGHAGKPSMKVLIETWGCQMNTADSEHMLGLLRQHNYTATTNLDDADLIILNTCHIREKAKHKVLSRLGTLKEFKDKKPSLIIAVTGCIPQMAAAELLKSSSAIDLAIGPGKINELPALIHKFRLTHTPVIATGFDTRHHTDHEDDETAIVPMELLADKNPISRFVNIIQGCENYCTYCVVPYTRGKEYSRDERAIRTEINHLIHSGAKEITLLGQNVNNFGLAPGQLIQDMEEATPFVRLLESLLPIPEIDSLRFTTSNPYNFSRPLAQLFGKHPKLGKYLHLPVQSGSNAILERMNRKITVEKYLEKISWLKQAVPDMALSTDLIVGFPGETDEDFNRTMQLIEDVGFTFSFAFKYSPRPGTPAAKFENQIPEKVKEERLAQLMVLQDKLTTAAHLALIGKKVTAQCHYLNKKEPNSYYGRTECFKLTKIYSPVDITGKVVTVLIKDANKRALESVVVAD